MAITRRLLANALLLTTIMVSPRRASAQGVGVIETILGAVIPGIAQKVLGSVKRAASGDEKTKENKAADSAVTATVKQALSGFTTEAPNLQRLREAADVSRRALTHVWALNVFASDAFHDHASQYPDIVAADLAAQVMDNYAALRQVLSGAKFTQMTNDGVSDYLLNALIPLKSNIDKKLDAVDRALSPFSGKDMTPERARQILTAAYGLRSAMWPLMDDLNNLSEQLNAHLDIYRRDLNKQLGALGLK